MAFGLGPDGFTKKKLSDIRSEIQAQLTESLGPIDTSPESTFGQIIDVLAEREALIWDLAEQVWLAFYLPSAQGVNLDAVASIVGLTRQAATNSTSFLMMFGTPGTVIPEGNIFEQSGAGQQFVLDNGGTDTTIDTANAARVIMSLDVVADATTYSFDLDDGVVNPISYLSGAGATEESILNGLALAVDGLGNYKTTVANSTLTIQRNDNLDGLQTTFTIANETNVTVDSYGTEGSVRASNTGEIAVPASSIDSIVNAVTGLDSVDNVVQGTIGTETETDEDFRTRISNSTQIAGAATVPAIESRLVDDLSFVSAATVLENRTSVTDAQGLPPHSFEAILSSSDESPAAKDQIATEIFTVKPAGIQTFGNQSGNHTDSQGQIQVMNFSFTEQVFIYLDIFYSLYDEEIFPPDGEDRIKTAVAELGNADAEAGLDVIIQRLYQAVFSVPGVSSVDQFNTGARLAVSGGPGGVGDPTDISIVAAGTTDGVNTNQLIDTSAFFTLGVERIMWAYNVDANQYSLVTGPTATPSDIPVNNDTTLDLENDIFQIITQQYNIGDWGQDQNLPINPRQIAVFDPTRIRVTQT